jgi:O-antigen ligase
MWRERPLLGIGPDVFRHTYGPRLGLTLFDTRIHTNSLYLELLTGAGVIGLGAFLWLAGAALIEGWRALAYNLRPMGGKGWRTPAYDRRPTGDSETGSIILLAAMLGICAFLIHGLLDVFLAFTPTYGLLWALIGVAGGIGPRSAR